MNEIIERLEELREQGEMVSRVTLPFADGDGWFVCTLAGPFGFHEQFRFEATDAASAEAICSEAINWLYPNTAIDVSASQSAASLQERDEGAERRVIELETAHKS
jgi:hypothetical protein